MFGRRQAQESPDALDWHVDFIIGLARTLRPEVYVELGLFQAKVFNKVLPYVGRAIGVDIDPATERFVKKNPKVWYLQGTTDDLAARIAESGTRIDMLFIDADHCRESVLKDFRTFFPLVKPHGIILLHDTHPGDERLIDPGWCGDAYKAIEELQAEVDGFEMMTIPRSPGLTLCRKRRKQLSWMEQPADD